MDGVNSQIFPFLPRQVVKLWERRYVVVTQLVPGCGSQVTSRWRSPPPFSRNNSSGFGSGRPLAAASLPESGYSRSGRTSAHLIQACQACSLRPGAVNSQSSPILPHTFKHLSHKPPVLTLNSWLAIYESLQGRTSIPSQGQLKCFCAGPAKLQANRLAAFPNLC